MAERKTKAVTFVDLSKVGKFKDRIGTVGIEIEGAWTTIPQGLRITRDGSLDDWYNGTLAQKGFRPNQVGEVQSPPIEPRLVPEWMKKYYPQLIHDCCGLHVHMGMKNALCYMRLGDASYLPTVVEYFKRWATEEGLDQAHNIWPRLRGENRYCQHKFYFDEQVVKREKEFANWGRDRQPDGHRYTAINYCFGRLGTVECRLLPMFDSSERAIRAVQKLLWITNAYLVATAKKESKEVAEAKVEDGYVREEHRVVV